MTVTGARSNGVSSNGQRTTRFRYTRGPSIHSVQDGSATIRRGHKGKDVRSIQRALNEAGIKPPLAEDGLFGPKTQRALKKFQQQQGMQATGVLGRDALARLQPHLATEGSGGPDRNVRQQRDDYRRTRRQSPRAPRYDARPPEGSVPARDLVRADESRNSSRRPRPPAPSASQAGRSTPPAATRLTQSGGVQRVATPRAGQTSADARLEQIQGRAVGSARTELAAGVREDRGRPNRSARVDQYAANARMRKGGAWCGYFTQFNYSQAAKEAGGKYRSPLHSFQKARAHFAYRSFTNNKRSYKASQDQLRTQHERQGSARRFMVLDGSSGQSWATRHKRPHEVFNPSTLPVRAGDTALFNFGHVGMVESYNRKTGMLTTVEGNISGGRVKRKTYDLNNPKVRRQFEAFGRPALGDFNLPGTPRPAG